MARAATARATKPTIDSILTDIGAGNGSPVYLVSGELVLAEPAGQRIADALAEKSGCEVERIRRPPSLGPVLADLRTFSLFASAKVILVIDSAIMADPRAGADLVDQAEAGLPVNDPEEELSTGQREAASRLLQALHVFGVDPAASDPTTVLSSLPDWAFLGGAERRKRHKNRPRGKKQAAELIEGLASLLQAALNHQLEGFAEGDLAELGIILEKGLPDGHSLVLVEGTTAPGHPVAETLRQRGSFVQLTTVEQDSKGHWQGLEGLAEELQRETGCTIARDALAELARRTLRQKGAWKEKKVDAESTSRLAAEYRKLAGMAKGQRIDRELVADNVEDRGEEDVWKILDALGNGQSGEALGRFRRMISGADDTMAARLSFFALLAGFCRNLAALSGAMRENGVSPGERSYHRFKARMAPALLAPLANGQRNPLAGTHPFRLHRIYLAASGLDQAFARQLPWRVLETELQVKGESSDPDSAIAALMASVATAIHS